MRLHRMRETKKQQVTWPVLKLDIYRTVVERLNITPKMFYFLTRKNFLTNVVEDTRPIIEN